MAAPKDRRRTGSPTPPPAQGLRAQVEQVSRPLLVRLSAMPRLLIPLLTIAVLAVGVLAPLPIGIPALVLVLLWMIWLSYLSWPAVESGQRVMRIATVGIVAAIIGVRLYGG